MFIFNSSVKDNITMFKNFREADIDNAIEKAGLRELITERGNNYICGENGVGLSGGERQRISIARSLIREVSILLVDEATSSLDKETAFNLSKVILELDGITRVVVTHMMEEPLLIQYDKIFVMKDGKIVENGSFVELMESKGYFYSLFTIAN